MVNRAHVCLLLCAVLETLFPVGSGGAPFGRQQLPELRPEASSQLSCSELIRISQANRDALPTLDSLRAAYNEQVSSVSSLILRAQAVPQETNPTAAAVKELHEISIMLFADRPARLRVIGIDPVLGMHLFDFATDGKAFSLLAPRRRQFFVGESGSKIASNTLFDRMDPQDLLDALFWQEIPGASATRMDSAGEDHRIRFPAVERNRPGTREVTLDRHTSRIKAMDFLGAGGAVVSSVQYESWTPAETTEGKSTCYPRHIRISHPADGYRLELLVTSAAVDVQIPMDRFYLAQPPSVQRIQLPPRSTEKTR